MLSLHSRHGIFPRLNRFAIGLLALASILGTPALTHADVQLKQKAEQPLSVQSAPIPLAVPCVPLDLDALPAGTVLTREGDVTFTVQQGVAGKVLLYPGIFGGENVNFGNSDQLSSPTGVVDNWVTMDEGHHRMMTNCNWTKAGVGYRFRDNPDWPVNWQNFWTLDLIP